jgi:hypothetical protein
MKSAFALVALLFGVLLVQGYARTERLSDSIHLGIVEALFEEAHPGVYVPRRSPDSGKLPIWVHVSFGEPLEDGRTFAVAALPEGMKARPGDIVEMRFGNQAEIDRHGPERNVVTAVLSGGPDPQLPRVR